MKIDNFIDVENIVLSEEEMKGLEGQTSIIIREIELELKRVKINAEVFVGGSFAKRTLMKKDNYDIDLFIRFKDKKEEKNKLLEGILLKVGNALKLEFKRIHGSREYYSLKSENVSFEIVPVKFINKPEEAENSTDLSYFHVRYINGKIKRNPKLAMEIIVAKAFCRANGVYGAESWVHGFSGYSLECLVVHYGGFEKMIKALSKVEGQLIIDMERKYKNKNEILIDMNESKRKGPIILVDPTYKERNVCSALSFDTFKRFQEAGKKFLKKPSKEFFETKETNEELIENRAEKLKAEYCKIGLKSDKQEGDIAGAKLEKFYRFLLEEISKRYIIKESKFDFDEKQEARIYIIAIPNKKVLQPGPPLKMEKEAKIFRKMHKDAFFKAGRLYAPLKVEEIHTFLEKWISMNKEKIKSMDVQEIIIC